MKNKEEIVNEFLNKDINKIEDFSPVVNNNNPFFKKADFEITEGIPKYFEPDELNRTSGAIAIISKYTLSIMVEKHLKYPDPHGWTEKLMILEYSKDVIALLIGYQLKRMIKTIYL